MRAKKDRYEAFSKVFAQLSDESQDQLVGVADRLLETHQSVKHKTAGQTKNRQKAKCRVKN